VGEDTSGIMTGQCCITLDGGGGGGGGGGEKC